MGNDAQLASPGESQYDCSSSASFMSILMITYEPSKLGQTDIVFGFDLKSSSV